MHKIKYKMNKEYLTGANPYLPLWEHVPDGEPRVFTYNGETRVYVYGSHDTLKTEYCGTDYVVWSAPENDLTDWRYDGVCYKGDGSPLYAPDVVQRGDTFYMYAAPERGSRVVVAESKNPVGPFENPRDTELGFDPAVLVDDDGRVYAYWGFCESWCAELNGDMATFKAGTVKRNMIPHCKKPDWFTGSADYEDGTDESFGFYEASSIRKIGGKYVFIYSKRTTEPKPDMGIYGDMNSYLDYCCSDSPMDGWVHGGTIIDCSGEVYEKPDGTKGRTYFPCNNHGSVVNVRGRWYCFYHRKCGTDEFARQGMSEPIDAAVGKDGRVYIGKVTYDGTGEPINAAEAEMTSQGAYVNGLDAYKLISAGYACHVTGGAYIKPIYEGKSSPIVNIADGTVIGFKYLQFGETSPNTVTVYTEGECIISVTADAPDGDAVAVINSGENIAELKKSITGKHSLYFTFESVSGNCSFDRFTFDRQEIE